MEKYKFVTKSVRIIVPLFSCKNVCQMYFTKQYFFIDHLNHKTVNKTTRRGPSANPRQLCAH